MIVALPLYEMERESRAGPFGTICPCLVSMWTLGDAFQSGDLPQMAFWVDPGTRNRNVDSGNENSVSFFFYRNLETLTGVLELQEIELARCVEHNCNEYHLAHRGLCY